MKIKEIEHLVENGTIRQALERSVQTMDHAGDIVKLLCLGISTHKSLENMDVERDVESLVRLRIMENDRKILDSVIKKKEGRQQ